MLTRTLIIGSLLLAPQVALAECPSNDEVEDLLQKGPVGQFVRQVIDRADDGIARARSAPGGSGFIDQLLYEWVARITSTMLQLVDTELRIVEHERDLATITPCLHLDLRILEAKMEEVRCEMDEAIERGSTVAILRLQSLTHFLNARYRHVVKGARDPLYQDPSWHVQHFFDDHYDTWCCPATDYVCVVKDSAECIHQDLGHTYHSKADCLSQNYCYEATEDITGEEHGDTVSAFERTCPFDSNYLAPNSRGFGCHPSVLENKRIGSIDDEVAGQQQMLQARDEFLEDVNHIKDVTLRLDTLLDERFLTLAEWQQITQDFGTSSTLNMPHRHAWGCFAADSSPPEPDPAIPPLWAEWASMELRGPFSFTKNHLNIWRKFFRMKHAWESGIKQGTGTVIGREYPDYLKHPYEFKTADERKEAQKSDDATLRLITFPRNYFRSIWLDFQLQQATNEAAILPKASDIQLQVLDAMGPLRPAVLGVSKTIRGDGEVGEPIRFTGLRKFTRDYAYFVRRSCIFRPCNGRLNRVLRIIFEPDCFPYTSGEYTSKDWRDCQAAIQ